MSEDDVKTLRSAIKFFTAAIASGMYYEMVNAQLNVFLNVHTTAIMQSSALVDECHALREAMHKSYSRIDDLFNEIRCTLSFHIGDAGV
jgi:U3 small nucleolar RNA-associated protein 21